MTIATSVGAAWLAGWLEDGRERSHELGPAPIGSDPWLLSEVRRALARDPALRDVALVVDVASAVVTIRGAGADVAERVERAAQSVQGIASLHVEGAP